MNEPTAPDLSKLDDVYPASSPPLKIYPKLTTDKVTEIVRAELDADKKLYPQLYPGTMQTPIDPMQTLIDQKIQANNKFNNNVMIIKDIKLFYEQEVKKYKKLLSKWKSYTHVSEVVEIVVTSVTSAATGTAVSISGVGLPFTIPTVMATTLACGTISAGINNKLKNKVLSHSKKYVLAKQFAEKYQELYVKVTRDNHVDTQEYDECTKLYEKYKKSKKNFLE